MNLNFAENFKQLRKEREITQEKIAEELGVSSQSISRWELSICYPDIELLPSITNYFGVTVDSLLSNDKNSKERDRELFDQTIDSLSNETTERIDYAKEFCRKYPDDDYYSYNLLCAIKNHVVGNKEKTDSFMPLMLKHAERLLEMRYRSITISIMSMVCDEEELNTWLDKALYSGFGRRDCLLQRSYAQNDEKGIRINSGLMMFETLGAQLDERYPDKLRAKKKAEYQSTILRMIESFGKNGEIPNGWKCFYAYKQLVLAACLFGQRKTDEGWENFNSAIDICKSVHSTKDKWLDIGGELFYDLKVSPDWRYAIDESGDEHKILAMYRRSFYDMEHIYGLLTNPKWAWFNSVRECKEYKEAVRWVKSISDKNNDK